MQVAKWGNSLAVRIPADVIRELGLKEGDTVDLCSVSDAQVAVISREQRRKAALAELDRLPAWMPGGYAFDRDEIYGR